MRLLIRAWPNVDVAVLEEAPFVDKWPAVGRPCLDDQVESFPLPLVAADWIAVCRRKFVGNATYEADFKPAVRQHVDQCHFLSDTNRITTIRNWIAENEQPRFFGQPRQRPHHYRGSRINAGSSLMVLVEHQIHALAFGGEPFLEIAVV